MNLKNALVLKNDLVGPGFYKLGLETGYDAKDLCPGQFIMVQVPGLSAPLLRRPFSIYNAFGADPKNQCIEVLYKVVGKGTETLAQVKKGEVLNVLGALGKGFTFPDLDDLTYIVGGGIGIAPLYFLVSKLLEKGWKKENLGVFFGTQSKSEMALVADFEAMGLMLHLTTDDGSMGQKGFITELLNAHLEKTPPRRVYACGPVNMLKTVAQLAESHKVSCQISLETTMACGMGACLGCAIKNSADEEKYAHVCMDGPVFDLETFKF